MDRARVDRIIAKAQDLALLLARAPEAERARVLVELEEHRRNGTCGDVEHKLIGKLIDVIREI